MEKKQYAKDISVGHTIDAPFVVVEKKLMDFATQKRAGEKFMLLRLRDNSGVVKAVVWDNAEQISHKIAVDDVVRVKGKTQDYRGVQIIVEKIVPLSHEEIDLTPFVPSSPKGEERLYLEMKGCIDKVKNTYIKRLLEQILLDAHLGPMVLKAPAGRKVHHNYLGGLVEHSLEVVTLLDSMFQMYPTELDKDLLIAGGLLHDIGKIFEYDIKSPSFQLTDRGKLLGHITLGEELLREKIATIPDFPEAFSMELRHMVISHHGEKEWGSPEIPKTFNAFSLFYADLVSSRLNQVKKLIKESVDSGSDMSWTEFDPLLGRAFYLSKQTDDEAQISFDSLELEQDFTGS